MSTLDIKTAKPAKISKASKTRERIIDCYLDMIPEKSGIRYLSRKSAARQKSPVEHSIGTLMISII